MPVTCMVTAFLIHMPDVRLDFARLGKHLPRPEVTSEID
jgi:hypothetical protein